MIEFFCPEKIRQIRESNPQRCSIESGKSERLEEIISVKTGVRPQFLAEILSLLDGEEVLAYDSGWKSQRRFARALRSRLESAAGPLRLRA